MQSHVKQTETHTRTHTHTHTHTHRHTHNLGKMSQTELHVLVLLFYLGHIHKCFCLFHYLYLNFFVHVL